MAIKQQNREFKNLYNQLKNMKLANTYISGFNYVFSENEIKFIDYIESEYFKENFPHIHAYITAPTDKRTHTHKYFKTEFKANFKYYQNINIIYAKIQQDYAIRFENNKIQFADMEFSLNYFLDKYAKNDLKLLIIDNIIAENMKLFLLITSSNKAFSDLNLYATNPEFKEVMLNDAPLKRNLLNEITMFIKYYQMITNTKPCLGKQIELSI